MAAAICGALRRVELAVGIGHQGFVVVVHAGSPLSSASAAASAVRPRASRLVSVPIGNFQHLGRFLVRHAFDQHQRDRQPLLLG